MYFINKTANVHSLALIDCGISRYRFINHFYTHKHNIYLILLNTPWILEAFDEKPTKYSQIPHIA